MNIIKKVKQICTCCMCEHEVLTVEEKERNIFKNIEVSYNAIYNYCNIAEEYFETEEQIAKNDISMKNAYREKKGLLTSEEIYNIREKYGITQSDLSMLLGWGAKTITRYEGHQVQNAAHDAILRKIDDDPQWYIYLLKSGEDNFSELSFQKYYSTALEIYEQKYDEYLKKSIYAHYSKYENNHECNGGKKLDLDKVVDVIRYFSNSLKVKSLYKVKLMKLLWYADSLSHKLTGVSMTGLVYKALPMGAVPVGYDLIIDLKGINYEEIDFDEGTGYHFITDNNNEYTNLTQIEKDILDLVIEHFGAISKKQIVEIMHKEQGYMETAPNDVIQYKYSKYLSI